MKRRPRKRTLLMVLLLLTGGAIINVAVAWGLAIWTPTSGGVNGFASWESEGHAYQALYGRNAFACSTMTMQFSLPAADKLGSLLPPIVERDSLPRWSYARNRNASDLVDSVAIDSALGWPTISLRHRFVGDLRLPTLQLTGGIRLPPNPNLASLAYVGMGPLDEPRALPCIPIWPGFAINTIFYAAILWLLFAAPGFVRRRIRARRGQCPACAYPVGASDVCTECGRPLR